MKVLEAMQRPVSYYKNINVRIWAIPHYYEGSQARFTLDCEAVIALEPPSNEYKEVWHLYNINYHINKGVPPQQILDMIHSWYRVDAPIQNPFY